MSATFNQITITIPAGWEDQTVVTLVGPAPGSSTPLVPRSSPASQPSIALRELKTPPGVDPQALADVQEEALAAAAVDLEVAVRGTVDLGAGKGVSRELCFGPAADRVRQIHLYFVRQGRFFVVIGTGNDDLRFEQVRNASLAVARSLAIAG